MLLIEATGVRGERLDGAHEVAEGGAAGAGNATGMAVARTIATGETCCAEAAASAHTTVTRPNVMLRMHGSMLAHLTRRS